LPHLVDRVQRRRGGKRREDAEGERRSAQGYEGENPCYAPSCDEISDKVQGCAFRELIAYIDQISIWDQFQVMVWKRRYLIVSANCRCAARWGATDGKQPAELLFYTGKRRVEMSDGREEREEREKLREQEEREDREDRINRELADTWEPERDES
jgi:hypothetical protein